MICYSTIATAIDAARRNCHLRGESGNVGLRALDVADTFIKKGYGLHDDIMDLQFDYEGRMYLIPENQEVNEELQILRDAVGQVIRLVRSFREDENAAPNLTLLAIIDALNARPETTTIPLRNNNTEKNNA